jgi:phosphonate transport system permease protein
MTSATAERAGRTARERIRPPVTRQGVLLGILCLVTLAGIVVSWVMTNFGVVTLFSGLGDMWTFVKSTMPPAFSDPQYSFAAMLRDVALTLSMAVLGTVIATILSIPLGILAARNTTPHPAVRVIARLVITCCRAVPDLVFALVFREALGIGVLPGVLALGLHSIGMLGKVYGDAIEQVPTGPREAVTTTGASRLQTITSAVVPAVSPSILSNAIYRFDINLRSSVVLGFVGAGGIGFTLDADMNTLNFRLSMGIIIVMTALILVVEFLSAGLRSALIGIDQSAGRSRRWWRLRRGRPIDPASPVSAVGPRSRGAAVKFDRDRVRPALTVGRVVRSLVPYLVIAILVGAWTDSGISVAGLQDAPSELAHTLAEFYPPDFHTAAQQLYGGMGDSVIAAVMGTFVGGIIAVPVAFLAARNIATPWVYGIVRVLLVIGRAVPELIIAIMFVVAVGPGLLAGVFALIVGTVAFLAKLVSDRLEEAAPGPRNAIRSTGAGSGQEVITAVVPPALPGIVGNLLYMFDINFRSSVLLGIVGAGGIGFLLSQSIQTFTYQTTSAIVVLTFVVVVAIEQLSNWVRRALA